MKNIGLFFFFILNIACSSSVPLHSIDEEIPKPAPNYSKIEHWIAHPVDNFWLNKINSNERAMSTY